MRCLDRARVGALLGRLAEMYEIHGPREREGAWQLERIDPARLPEEVSWNAFRVPAPLKPLWFQAARVVATWGPDGPADGPATPPRLVLGAKACDLRALAVLDRVLRTHTYGDPAYRAAREQTVIVSGDCTDHGPSCFCTMLGDRPYPDTGFDLNLSPVGDSFVVETGSARGEQLLTLHLDLTREATAGEIETRDRRRQELAERVAALNEPFRTRNPFQESVERSLKTPIWAELAATCVECGACNYVCPTCHCFLLHDVRTAEGAARVRLWDSCFHAGYARMAGGGTPRLQLTERFKNHYFHKFVAFPVNWGVVACTGCGRCVDACMGRIDKRDCLHRLETR
jgi:sulfhydrogenase subunit beta (sulfur reductase)